MTISFERPLTRLGMIVAVSAALAGCQTIADLDPTGMLSDDMGISDTQSLTPDLAAIPSAPQIPDTEAATVSALNAAGVQAQYSADALRAGTEPAAPPPVAAQPLSPEVAQAFSAASAPAAPPPVAPVSAPPTTASTAPIPVAGNAAPAAPAPAPVAASPIADAPIPVAGNAAPAPSPSASAPVQAAMLPPGAQPAVPAVPPAGAIRGTIMPAPVVSDAQLGFRPSSAPPLDSSISNFVPAPIVTRFQQTAAASGGGAFSAVPGAGGAVLSKTGAEPSSAIAAIAARNGGIAPAGVVYFPGDGTALNAAARTQIRSIVAAFKAAGGNGRIRVVGHASSRTANMPVERHLETIFAKSQARANAVARELMNQGIPSSQLQIDAVGDSQPIYYESMPRGEEGNRRAEIYVQS